HQEVLERYAAEVRQHLAQSEFAAAQAVLKKAGQLAPGHPLVLCLEQEIRQSAPTAAVPESTPSVTSTTDQRKAIAIEPRRYPVLRQDNARFLLAGLATAGELLVVAKPLVTLGSPRETDVDMPIQARLRPQHALIVRQTSPGPNGETHRLIPSAGAFVRVNDATVNEGSSVWLTHGDRLQIGPEISRWTYRRPVKDSKTAVLEQTRPDGAVATLSGGITVRRVVLLDDELRIGRDREQNHLVEVGFPVSRLRLVFRSGHWRAVAERGALFINDSDDSDEAARPMNLPAELVLFNDDQNLLAGALQGERQDYTRTLRLTIV
ncbi:MAG: hypothetical protein KDA38_13720, partial [Planctomycetales bacterium]|nr:hypothetical protein [Planctomycetales bacterium]